jgi:hypothetical protein
MDLNPSELRRSEDPRIPGRPAVLFAWLVEKNAIPGARDARRTDRPDASGVSGISVLMPMSSACLACI